MNSEPAHLQCPTSLLRAFASEAPVGFACWDANVRCVEVNDYLARTLGRAPHGCRGLPPHELFSEIGPQVAFYVRRVLATGAPLSNVGLAGTSSVPRFLCSFFPASDEYRAGARPGVCAGMMLIDFRRDAETRREPRSCGAAGVRDHVLAHVGHELRTPLMPVLLCLSGLIEDGATPGGMKQQLVECRAQLRLLTMLIDDLHDWARIRHGKLVLHHEPVRMHRVIAEAVDVCRPAFVDARVGVTTDLAARDDRICGDPRRLVQVLWNLLQNAAQYTAPGGTVHVCTRNSPTPGANRDGGRVRIEVRDTGVGIDPSQLTRIFDEFERLSHARHGGSASLGLGLSIARAVTQMHGGTLTAHSEGLGTGSTFTLEFPVLGAASAVPHDGRAAPNGGR